MARMGRPKLENPRSEGVFIRLTKDEHTDITEIGRASCRERVCLYV